MDSFFPSKLSSDWPVLYLNELMAYHCNELEKNETLGSSLDGTLHILTPTTIYNIDA